MAVAYHSAVAKLAAIINAGMVFRVADGIICMPAQCADDAQIRLEACRKCNRSLLVDKGSNFILECNVKVECAV